MAAHVPPSVADSNGQVDRAGVKAAGNSNCADDTVRSLAPSGASGRAAADPSAAPTCPGAGKARNSVASYLRERLAATATAERRDPPAVPPKALKSAVVVPAARQRPAAAQPPESCVPTPATSGAACTATSVICASSGDLSHLQHMLRNLLPRIEKHIPNFTAAAHKAPDWSSVMTYDPYRAEMIATARAGRTPLVQETCALDPYEALRHR